MFVPPVGFEPTLLDNSKQIGSKCASLLYILCISVLLQNLVIGEHATNHIILSLHGNVNLFPQLFPLS